MMQLSDTRARFLAAENIRSRSCTASASFSLHPHVERNVIGSITLIKGASFQTIF